MAEIQNIAEPEINPIGTLVGLVTTAVLVFAGLEIIKHESNIFSVFSALNPFQNMPTSTVDTSTNNQNPGTTSEGSTQTSTSSTSQPSAVSIPQAQGLITISNVNYGVYGLLPSIAYAEGKILADDSVKIGPCDKVTADVTLVNHTENDYDVILYGYLIPAGQSETPSSSVGHFWPGNAQGILPGTKYTGIYPGKITAKSQVVTSNVSTAPLSVPNEKFGVLWQVYITGQASYTSQKFDPLRIFDNFTSTPSCKQG